MLNCTVDPIHPNYNCLISCIISPTLIFTKDNMTVIINETNRNYIIDSLTQPLPLRHHWNFSAQMRDFVLSEILYLEETVGPTVTLLIDGSEVKVPGSWSILIVDKETYTIDAVPVSACAAFSHEAFVFSPTDSKLITAPVSVVAFEQKGTCIYPAIDKAFAMVHAITSGLSRGVTVPRGVVVGPHDLWRYLSGCTVGDILEN